MSKRNKSEIVELKPITHPDGRVTYIPQRQPLDVMKEDASPLSVSYPQRQPRATVETKGSYTDKAKAFSLKTWQVSLLAGIGLYLLGRLLRGYPWLSVGAILTLLGGVGLVWLTAYALDLIFSPEGAELLDIAAFWAYMRTEQRERHRRYNSREGGRHE